MNRTGDNKQTVAIDEIVALLSKLSEQLLSLVKDEMLKPVVNEVNTLAQQLRNEVQAQVQVEREQTQVIHMLGIGIWKWDLVSNALEWDDNMYRLYGLQRSDFNGAYDAWESSLSEATKAKAVEEINIAVAGGKDFDTTFQVVHKSGKIQELRTRAFVIRDENGKPLKMHGINIDRTREADLERAIEQERAKSVLNAKLASLGEMSAGIAHEINNPLGIIAGTVRILPRFASDPVQLKSRIDAISNASDRIAKIVQSLRKFSRSDERSPHTDQELSTIVSEALVLTAGKSRRHSTPVSVDYRCRGLVACDAIEIEQVMINLIGNAIDAVKNLAEKWVRIELFEEGSSVVLRVQDSGLGISPEVRVKLFLPFFTTKPIGQGTGLGLSIVKGILDEHNATIELIASDPHTCFEIRFPMSKVKKDVL